MDVSFKEKVEFSDKAYHFSLKVVGDYYVNAGESRCFFRTASCMKGVVPVVQKCTIPCPNFCMSKEIHLWPVILVLSG